MKTFIADFRSDTVTKPTEKMLQAMLKAKTGDDVFEEDPTVRELEKKTANLFNQETGLFCPTGTMSNQIGVLIHTNSSQEVICHKDAHVYRYESGGIAFHSRCSIRTIEGDYGRIDPALLKSNINNPYNIHSAISALVCVEDTTNKGGGAFYDYSKLKEIRNICTEHKLSFHLDGARLFNALTQTQISSRIYGKIFDSISICLSKGLGAPMGSVLLGSEEKIRQARRWRKLLGGGMRQSGYMAACGIYALDHHVERLKEDHQRAKILSEELKNYSWCQKVYPCLTNIVLCEVTENYDEAILVQKMRQKGILAMAFGEGLIRFITHLDIQDNHLENSIKILKDL